MTEDNFYLIGRAIQKEHPEYFLYLADLVQQTESQALNDIDQLPELYNTYCALVGDSASPIKAGRQPVKVINQRRLFIAASVYLFDPMFFNDYSGRMRDKLRLQVAAVMQCCPEWVSNSTTSVKFEYKHINTFRMQVNLIAYCLRKKAESLTA